MRRLARLALAACALSCALAGAHAEASGCCARRLAAFARVSVPVELADLMCHECYPTERFINDTHWRCADGSAVAARALGATRATAAFPDAPCALPDRFVLMKRATATVTGW